MTHHSMTVHDMTQHDMTIHVPHVLPLTPSSSSLLPPLPFLILVMPLMRFLCSDTWNILYKCDVWLEIASCRDRECFLFLCRGEGTSGDLEKNIWRITLAVHHMGHRDTWCNVDTWRMTCIHRMGHRMEYVAHTSCETHRRSHNMHMTCTSYTLTSQLNTNDTPPFSTPSATSVRCAARNMGSGTLYGRA